MAFERPLEADRVEDLGLFSSFLRAPVVGTILWLLGGEDAKKADEEERRRSGSDNEGDFRDYELKKGSDVEPWPQIASGVDSDSDDASFPSYETFVTSSLSTPQPSKRSLHSVDSGPASRVVDELVAVMDAASVGGMTRRSPKRSSSRSNLASLDDIQVDIPPIDTQPSSSHSHQANISKKKMSWSDEKKQPLVEYFDDKPPTRYRRNSWRPSRSCSFDSQDTRKDSRGRSQVRIIKSALKRSGSYSPPMPMMYPGPLDSMSTASSCGSGGKSFRSLSAIGSTDSDSVGAESLDLPSSLQMGRGGLILPAGSAGASCSHYHLTLGTAVSSKMDGGSTTTSPNEESKTLYPEGNPISGISPMPHPHSGRQSSKPHHFLPHHSNGYISPQYGFYVNITPPTPEMFYPRPPPGTFSKDAVQQPSHQQFAKPFRPSPIPEVTVVNSPHNENKKPPLQPMFQESPRETPVMKKTMKPTFIKNKRMGMFLSENPHQVYPTVPFG
jgi:hypothetical protein